MNSTYEFTLNCYTTTVLQYGKKISLHFLSLSNKSVSPDDLLLRMGEYDLGARMNLRVMWTGRFKLWPVIPNLTQKLLNKSKVNE